MNESSGSIYSGLASVPYAMDAAAQSSHGFISFPADLKPRSFSSYLPFALAYGWNPADGNPVEKWRRLGGEIQCLGLAGLLLYSAHDTPLMSPPNKPWNSPTIPEISEPNTPFLRARPNSSPRSPVIHPRRFSCPDHTASPPRHQALASYVQPEA
jgi:hypothetical protein